MAVLPRRLYRSLLSSNLNISPLSMPFCSSSSTTNNLSSREEDSGLDASDTHSLLNSTTSSSPPSSTTPEGSSGSRMVQDRPLENGLDVGIYKVNATLYLKKSLLFPVFCFLIFSVSIAGSFFFGFWLLFS